jgi:pimeloyl-ACP methyl ester carboxylesterase
MTRVLLLHGWDWEKYPVFRPQHQWQNRQEFVAELQKYYNVDYPSMPGFSHHDANRTGSWTLDDYADWLQEEIANQRYAGIIGYSFGCAVAAHWQYLYRNTAVPLILASPAISRAYNKPPNKILTASAGILKRLHMEQATYFLRKLYLTRVRKNPHVIHGTPFLQATYSNIVSVDLSNELAQLIDDHYMITCTFGSEDTATPPDSLFSRAPTARPLSLIIPGGTHDIGSTHPKELANHIVNFMNSSKARERITTEDIYSVEPSVDIRCREQAWAQTVVATGLYSSRF